MKIHLIWHAVFLLFTFSCNNQENTDQNEINLLKTKLPTLRPNQALIKVMINNKDFYAKESFFETEVELLPQLFKAGFQNKEGSMVEIEMIRNDWFEQKHTSFKLANKTLGESGGDQVFVMLGKLTDKRALRGEGYLLVNGKINIPELSHHLISIMFEGNLVKPYQASTKENYIPVKGWIVVKKPAFTNQSSAELLKKFNSAIPDK
jgi:hypothetical protein